MRFIHFRISSDFPFLLLHYATSFTLDVFVIHKCDHIFMDRPTGWLRTVSISVGRRWWAGSAYSTRKRDFATDRTHKSKHATDAQPLRQHATDLGGQNTLSNRIFNSELQEDQSTLISAKAHYSDVPIGFRHQIWQFFGIFASCRSHRSSTSVTVAFYADYIALFGLTLQELVIFGRYQCFISADTFTMFLLKRPHLPIGSATVWLHA